MQKPFYLLLKFQSCTGAAHRSHDSSFTYQTDGIFFFLKCIPQKQLGEGQKRGDHEKEKCECVEESQAQKGIMSAQLPLGVGGPGISREKIGRFIHHLENHLCS